MKRFNLTCDYTKLFPKFIYWGGTTKPSFNLLLDCDRHYHTLWTKLIGDSIFTSLKDKCRFYCIEFNDLNPNKAFDTFCKLADIIGFNKPTNKETFTDYINPNTGSLSLFPTTLYVHLDDLQKCFQKGQKEKRNLASLDKKDGFSIDITYSRYVDFTTKNNFVDLSSDFGEITISNAKILILIHKDEHQKLKNNVALYQATKTYLEGYINALKAEVANITSKHINEEQILEFLKTNKKSRKFIKDILDKELNYIKANHPDFIQKWKHYLEFEKMCAKLDTK